MTQQRIALRIRLAKRLSDYSQTDYGHGLHGKLCLLCAWIADQLDPVVRR